MKANGVVYGRGLRLYGVPRIGRKKRASISLGSNVSLRSRQRENVLGLARPCLITATEPTAAIEIGDDVSMSGVTLVAAKRIEIGDRTMIGAEAIVVDTDLHPLDPAGGRHIRRREPYPNPSALEMTFSWARGL